MRRTEEQQKEIAITNPGNYLFLAGRHHGNCSYPDLAVSLHRLGYSQAIAHLDFKPRNTAKEADDYPYLGDIDHAQALRINALLSHQTMTPRQFVDFLNEVNSGRQIKKTILDIAKNPISGSLLDQVWDEITEKRSPYRAEHLNQYCFKKGKELYLRYHFTQDKALEPIEAPLEDCLMEDKELDFFDWLARANNQGLPPRDVAKGDFKYWYPRANTVARFGADSDGADLDCDGYPLYSFASLGVRAAISIGNFSPQEKQVKLEEALQELQGYIAPLMLPQVRERLRKYF